MTTVTVTSVTIPAGSTIGYGIGETDDGRTLIFAGDWRPMADLPLGVDVELEPWQVLG